MKNQNLGSSFDSWLQDEQMYDAATTSAIKRVLARQLQAAMEEQSISKAEMASRMATSKTSLYRLLDPENDSVTLGTLQKAAHTVGRTLRLELA